MHGNDKKFKTIIILLVVLLIVSLGYITFDKYKTIQEKKLLTVYQNGYLKGIQESVVSIYKQTNNCQPAIIKIGNVTRQVFDTACLQNLQQS